MAYGFRLFELTLLPHHRRSPDAVAWVLPGGTHYVDHAGEALDLLAGIDRRLLAEPGWNAGRGEKDIPIAGSHRGDKVVRWTSFSAPAALHLSARIRSGTVGSHTSGLADQQADDADLETLAPTNEHRVELLFPAQDGHGVLAVETIGRRCPVESVPRWITVAGEVLGGTPGAGGSDNLLWKLAANPLVDRGHLEDMLVRSEKVTLGLRGNAPSSGLSSGAGVTLDIEVNEGARSTVVREILRRVRGEDGTPDDLLRLMDLGDPLGSFDFTDGKIRVEEPGGESKTMWLSRIEEIFTYPTTKDIPPTDASWTESVKAKISTLRPDLTW